MSNNSMPTYFGTVGFWVTAIIVVIVIGLFVFSNKIFKVYENKVISKSKDHKISIQRKTTAHFISSIIKALIVVFAVIVILQVNGVNVTSLVAGLGILSAIIGLALQDLIKDIVSGLRIVSEHYFGVGDVIVYGGIEGEVVSLSIRSTAIRDINNNQVITISNRMFADAYKLVGEENIDVKIPYETKTQHASEVLKKACEEINELEAIETCEFRGLQDFEDSAITYRVWYKGLPVNKPANHRAVNAIIKKNLDEAGIEIPFTQIDIHQK